MGLLQRAVETYDANEALVGIYREGHEPLAPVGHTLTSAGIEITLDRDGNFQSGRKVDKSEPKILLPVTEESAGRTSGPVPHPLCEQLKYVASKREKEHGLYLEQLRSWAESRDAHPFLGPILAYVEGGTVLSDLTNYGVLADGNHYDEKLLICWRVLGFEGEEPACWRNRNLFQAFIRFYEQMRGTGGTELCMIEGEWLPAAAQHPKGIIPINGNAKLISANDSSGFTYRGRFSREWQAATVSYTASQKAHNALRWLASEQGVRELAGNRIFLCWNPQGKKIPRVMRRLRQEDETPRTVPTDYRKALQSTMLSLRADMQLQGTEAAVVAAFDAATTGRLALTYYNETSLPQFLERLQDWDAHCCWYAGKFGIQAPNLFQLVDNAFGTQRGAFLETDDKIQRQHLQRLLGCKLSGGVFPADIVRVLVQRASTPQAFDEKIWRRIVHSACSALQKYRYDTMQGGNEMAWELDKKDRSFQFGRLLAAMERGEADYYYRTQEERQTNAIKFLSEFRQRPWTTFEYINRQLQQAYLPRIESWQRKRYERLIGEICGLLREFPEVELNRPLEDIYLMGYELQRNDFFRKNPENETKNTDNETEE